MLTCDTTEIKFDDYTLNDKSDHFPSHWSSVCQQHAEQLPNYRELITDPGFSICGVENCRNSGDYYYDFYPKEI